MVRMTVAEVAATVEQLKAQIAELSRRIESLQPAAASAAAPANAPVETRLSGISEEELLAISAALAAYLGVRPHIRQIRLVGTTAWAQQGRVSIQASHRLQG